MFTLFGYTGSELVGKKIDILLPMRLVNKHRSHTKKFFISPYSKVMGAKLNNIIAKHSDGHEFTVEVSLACIKKKGKYLICSTIRDVSQRKLNELLIKHTSKTLAMASLGKPSIEIYNSICIFYEDRYYPNMSSSILRLDGNHLRHCSSPSLPEKYINAIDGVQIGENVGSCGTAAFYGKEVIVDDIENDPLWSNFRDVALKFNLKACWSEPIFNRQDKVVGTFAMYFNKPYTPTNIQLHEIRSASKLVSIIMEREANDKEIEYLINTDYLTSLYNRRFFMDAFDRELKRAKRFDIEFVINNIRY